MCKLVEQHTACLKVDTCGVVIGKRLLDVTCAVEDGHVAVSAAFCRYAVNIFEGVVQTIHAWYAVLLRIIESVEHLTCHLIYICVRVRDEGVVNL